MMSFDKFLFIFLLISLCQEILSVESTKQRLDENSALKLFQQIALKKGAKKDGWKLMRKPRTGVLIGKTQTKTLNAGILNCGKNRISPDEIKGLSIRFPSARKDVLYTLIVFSNNILVKAIANIQALDMYEGNVENGYKIFDITTDIEDDQTEQLVYVELFEQKKSQLVPESDYDRNGWNELRKKWAELFCGTAGKTCFIIQPPKLQGSTPRVNDITILLQQFNINLNKLKQIKSKLLINPPKHIKTQK